MRTVRTLLLRLDVNALNVERRAIMTKFDVLLEPKDCALVLLDQQAGLAFGIGSIDRQMLLNNVIALARAAKVFDLPIVASTSATKVYSGPLMPSIQAAIPEIVAIDRRNM